MKIIDPHLHLFNLEQGDYHWLKMDNPPFWPDKYLINRNFNESDLLLNEPLELAGFVHIEAGFDNKKPWREIAWLEEHCQLPFKSVAAIDLTLNKCDFIHQVDKLLNYQSVVGCRHILDGEAPEILQNNNVKDNLIYLATKELSFDCQMPVADSPSLALLVKILKEVPTLTIIIDHAGWPPFQNRKSQGEENTWLNWQAAIKTLSQFEHCAIKCSGWEMIDRNYSADWQQKVISHCIDTFGDNRVMLASNFPLTLFSKSYQCLWQTYAELNLGTQKLTTKQLIALTSANAINWYCLAI